MIKAIALDAFDTTVYISEPRRAYQRLAESAGHEFSAELMSMKGDIEVAARALRIYNGDLIRHLKEDLEVELASVMAYPDVGPVLAYLRSRGIRLAIASNVTAPFAAVLRRIFVTQVDVLLFSCEVGSCKPSTVFFRELINRLGIPPGQILMVGDSLNVDSIGALRAGLQAVLLKRAERASAPGTPDGTIRSLWEVNRFL